jgi:glutathione reductase (NADPH)
VAIADNREFGGTCANRGCDPKKVLLGGTEVLEMAGHLSGKGIKIQPGLSWEKLQGFKRGFVQQVPLKTEEYLKKLKIVLYHQSPRFLAENTLSVEGKTVAAKKIVIATGYEPRNLGFPGSHLLKNSEDFLKLKKLPESMIFIGAGYVGMEFAHMASRAGARVTMIDSEKRPLSNFDGDMVNALVSYSREMGITFINEADILGVAGMKKKYEVTCKTGEGTKKLKAGMIFNTAGRVPAIHGLDLEKGKVSYDENGIKVNEFLQNPDNKDVYACGDVSAHALPLTPLSGREGYVVGQNILKGNRKRINIPVIPTVVFTLPNLAAVGQSEEDAKKRYKSVTVKHESVANWFNARRINAPVYAYKTLVNERNGRLLGAHMVGPQAGETINLFAMAIQQGMTADQLQGLLFTYPSWSNDIKSMV